MKFTANAAAAPPHAMDSSRFGLRGAVIDMIMMKWRWLWSGLGNNNASGILFASAVNLFRSVPGLFWLVGWLVGWLSLLSTTHEHSVDLQRNSVEYLG